MLALQYKEELARMEKEMELIYAGIQGLPDTVCMLLIVPMQDHLKIYLLFGLFYRLIAMKKEDVSSCVKTLLGLRKVDQQKSMKYQNFANF